MRISQPPAADDQAWKCLGLRPQDPPLFVENEPHAASNPADRRNVVTAWQVRAEKGGAILTSTSFDGGASWTPSRAFPLNRCAGGSDPALVNASDPFVAFGPDNRAYVAAIGWASSRGEGPDPVNALLVTASRDGGRTWEPTVVAVPSRAPALTFDNVSLAADYTRPGTVYLASTLYEFPGVSNATPGKPLELTREMEKTRLGRGAVVVSRNGGRTWSEATPVTPKVPGGRVSAPQVAVDNGSGRVSLVYYWSNGARTGLSAVSSDDAGATWSAPVDVASFAPIDRHEDPRDGRFVQLAQDIVSLAAAPRGGLVMAFADGRYSGGRQGAVSLTRSPDGHTWTPPLRVSADEGTTAWLPAVAIDQDRGIGVAYMSATFGGEKTRPFAARLLRATFETGAKGLSPTGNTELDAYGYVWPGDYLGLVSVGGAFRAVYTKSNYGPDEPMPATSVAGDRKRTDVFSR